MSNRLPRGLALYLPDFYGCNLMQVSGAPTIDCPLSKSLLLGVFPSLVGSKMLLVTKLNNF